MDARGIEACFEQRVLSRDPCGRSLRVGDIHVDVVGSSPKQVGYRANCVVVDGRTTTLGKLLERVMSVIPSPKNALIRDVSEALSS